MIKSILVPMGTSKNSVASLEMAINLSNLFKAELRLLYVKDVKNPVTPMFSLTGGRGHSHDKASQEEEKKRVEEESEQELEKVQTIYNDYKSRIEGEHSLSVKGGTVAEEILKEANAADLLVMGKTLTTDSTGKKQSYIFNVIQKANNPMIAVSTGDVELGKNILIAYDNSKAANNALKVLGDFIPLLNPVIHVLTVKEHEEEANTLLEEAAKYLSPYKVEIKTVWKRGKEVENIVNIVKKENISCVVVGGYGDSKIKQFFVGNTTEEILKVLEIPVMVVNA